MVIRRGGFDIWNCGRQSDQGVSNGRRFRVVLCDKACTRGTESGVNRGRKARVPADPTEGNDTFSVLRNAVIRRIDFLQMNPIAGGN